MRPPKPDDQNQGNHEVDTGWKKRVTSTLKDFKIVGEKFTGKIVLNFNCGSISDLKKPNESNRESG